MYNDDELDLNDDITNIDVDDIYDDEDVDDILSDVVKPQKTKRRKTPEEYYVKGADLLNEIKKYQKSKQEDADAKNVPYEERPPEKFQKNFGLMILKICTRFSLHPRFFGYTYRDEMVAEAVTRCLTNRSR
jgi:hypothetical protein